jgi:hypothetical protein
MAELTAEKIHKLKELGVGPHYLWMDNAGENLLLQERAESKDWKLGLVYKYMARDTPQQNALAEIGFTKIGGRAKAMMKRAFTPDKVRHLVMPKALKVATKLDRLVPITINGTTKSHYEHLFGSNPPFAKHLRTWGEAGTVTLREKVHPKEKNKGVMCMFVDYAEHHAGDCYEMWDPKTARVHKTRDITWLHHMFYQKPMAVEVREGVDIEGITEEPEEEEHELFKDSQEELSINEDNEENITEECLQHNEECLGQGEEHPGHS